MSKIFNDKTILVTGGTGSFGKAFVRYVLDNFNPQAVRIFSRDELKQYQMAEEFSGHPQKGKLRFLIGDVRDEKRLARSFENVDVVVHAAALKQVPACEYNPIEAIKTNILGSVNVIDAALDHEVESLIALSTDKASEPINLYGATKLCADKLFIQANNYRGVKKTKFAVVRYGNVMASRGSVIPLFFEQAKHGQLTITDEDMTRFWITLDEAVKFVVSCFGMMQGGELWVPKLPSIKMLDLVEAIAPEARLEIVGIRPGEKLHESLISGNEALYTNDMGDRYMIEPTNLSGWKENFDLYQKKKPVPLDFAYQSHTNKKFFTIPQIRKKLAEIGYHAPIKL